MDHKRVGAIMTELSEHSPQPSLLSRPYVSLSVNLNEFKFLRLYSHFYLVVVVVLGWGWGELSTWPFFWHLSKCQLICLSVSFPLIVADHSVIYCHDLNMVFYCLQNLIFNLKWCQRKLVCPCVPTYVAMCYSSGSEKDPPLCTRWLIWLYACRSDF